MLLKLGNTAKTQSIKTQPETKIAFRERDSSCSWFTLSLTLCSVGTAMQARGLLTVHEEAYPIVPNPR